MFFNIDNELYMIFTNKKMSARKKVLFFLKITYNVTATFLILGIPLIIIIFSMLYGKK